MIVKVVSKMPCGVQVCVTSPVRLGTLRENMDVMDVCVTERETVIVEPASTCAGTGVITGFLGKLGM